MPRTGLGLYGGAQGENNFALYPKTSVSGSIYTAISPGGYSKRYANNFELYPKTPAVGPQKRYTALDLSGYSKRYNNTFALYPKKPAIVPTDAVTGGWITSTRIYKKHKTALEEVLEGISREYEKEEIKAKALIPHEAPVKTRAAKKAVAKKAAIANDHIEEIGLEPLPSIPTIQDIEQIKKAIELWWMQTLRKEDEELLLLIR